MKRWTIPAEYECIVDLFIMPLLLERREMLSVLSEPHAALLINAIRLNSATADDVANETDMDKRVEASYRYLGRETLKGILSSYVLERLGYNMGGNPPSVFLANHPVPIVNTDEESRAFAASAYNLNSPFRCAAYDWGIYTHCNGVYDTLMGQDCWWFYREKNMWVNPKDRQNNVKIFFAKA
jgi:hypothetical protein